MAPRLLRTGTCRHQHATATGTAADDHISSPSTRAPRRAARSCSTTEMRIAAIGAGGIPAAFSRLGLGRARPRGPLGHAPPPPAARRSRRPALDRRRHRRHRHHQPARDDAGLGPRDRQADPQRHRLAGPAHRRSSAASCATQGTSRRSPQAPACCSTPISRAPSSPGCSTMSTARASAGRGRRAAVRHRRQLPDLEADRRRGACHRRHQRRAARCSTTSARGAGTPTICELLGIPMAMLPEVRDCAADFGATRADLFGAPIPILGVAGDQQAATLGQACFPPGMLKSTYGTGCFALLNTGDNTVASPQPAADTIAYQLDGKPTYALEGSIFIAGAVVQWLRDGLKIIRTAAETQPLADGADPAQDVILVPAFTGLGAPYWNAECRGAIFGLTRNSGPGRIRPRRAGKRRLPDPRPAGGDDGADWQAAPRASGGVLRVDGGMSASDWAMQFLSDIIGAPVDRPEVLETTALGAAWLAGMRAGVYPGTEGFAESWALERRFEPADGRARRATRNTPPGSAPWPRRWRFERARRVRFPHRAGASASGAAASDDAAAAIAALRRPRPAGAGQLCRRAPTRWRARSKRRAAALPRFAAPASPTLPRSRPAVAAGRAAGATVVAAIGGGSVIDLGKAVGGTDPRHARPRRPSRSGRPRPAARRAAAAVRRAADDGRNRRRGDAQRRHRGARASPQGQPARRPDAARRSPSSIRR